MGTAYICYAYMQPKKLHSAYDIISASTETEIFPLEQHKKEKCNKIQVKLPTSFNLVICFC